MWRTTSAFLSRDWSVPQFYGKWPFKRFYGIQEPASVLFSYLNLLVHWRMIKKYRRECRSDSPMYNVWHIFCAVSVILIENVIIGRRPNFHYSMYILLDLLERLGMLHSIPCKGFSANRTT